MRIAVALFVVSLAANLVWLVGPLDWRMIPAVLVGWYLADFVSGAVHMYMDYHPGPAGVGLDRIYFYEGSRESEDYLQLRDQVLRRVSPFERLAYDFKNHHPRPMALGRRSLPRLIGSTVLVGALPCSLLLTLSNLMWPVPTWFNAGALTLLLGGAFAQYFHGTLHRQDVPVLVTALRGAGLLMTPAKHQIHHDTLQRDFATNSGWSNGVLNLIFQFCRSRGLFGDAGLEPTRH